MTTPPLSHDGLFRANAENDRDTSIGLQVYHGGIAFSIFKKGGGKPTRLPLSRAGLTLLRRFLKSAIDGTPGYKNTMNFNKYDSETKKIIPNGSLTVGKDDKGMVFFGVSAPTQPSVKFVMKAPISIDTADPLSDVDRSKLAAETLLDQLTIDIPVAAMVTSYKRENTSGAGGGFSSGARASGGDDSIY